VGDRDHRGFSFVSSDEADRGGQMIEKLLKEIKCWLENLFDLGYGDPSPDWSYGRTETISTTMTDWVLLLSADRASLLHLKNESLTAISITYSRTGISDPQETSPTIAQGANIVIDKFKGRLYVKGAGAIVNYYVHGRH
jgi:hypothetical protein